VIRKERMNVPRIEAQQWSAEGRKPVLAATTGSTSLPVGPRALRISIPCHTGHRGLLGGQLDILNVKTVVITR
jgi:hypothetical protein